MAEITATLMESLEGQKEAELAPNWAFESWPFISSMALRQKQSFLRQSP